MLRHRVVLVVAALAAGGCLSGCARAINGSAERRIRQALPVYIGPARTWRVRVDNPPERTLGGRLRRVTIDGQDARLPQTLTCESLHIEMQNVVVDTGRGRVRSVGSATFSATISEEGLNAYVRATPPPPGDPVRIRRVTLREGRFAAEGTRELLGHAWPFTLVVEPRLVSPTRLDFAPERMTVEGVRVPLPASVLQWIARRLDSGFDFGTLPFPVSIQSFRVSEGHVTLEGSADLTRFLGDKQSGNRTPG